MGDEVRIGGRCISYQKSGFTVVDSVSTTDEGKRKREGDCLTVLTKNPAGVEKSLIEVLTKIYDAASLQGRFFFLVAVSAKIPPLLLPVIGKLGQGFRALSFKM